VGILFWDVVSSMYTRSASSSTTAIGAAAVAAAAVRAADAPASPSGSVRTRFDGEAPAAADILGGMGGGARQVVVSGGPDAAAFWDIRTRHDVDDEASDGQSSSLRSLQILWFKVEVELLEEPS